MLEGRAAEIDQKPLATERDVLQNLLRHTSCNCYSMSGNLNAIKQSIVGYGCLSELANHACFTQPPATATLLETAEL